MRIGSGRFTGRRLHTPRGLATRPTSGRLKKSLFDTLASELEGARVLDLFAGAGALGLEALSRGAAFVVFVDRSRQAVEAIQTNLAELELEDQADILEKDVRSALLLLGDQKEAFDVVVMDPPYRARAEDAILNALDTEGLVAAGGQVAVEHHRKTELHEHYGRLGRQRELRAGESRFTLFTMLD